MVCSSFGVASAVEVTRFGAQGVHKAVGADEVAKLLGTNNDRYANALWPLLR
jgi:hypothetical protein